VADNAMDERTHTGGSHYLAGLPAPAGSCPSCGTYLSPASGQAVNVMFVRVPLPQPMAMAVRRARMLAPREWAVFRLLGSGYANRSIARQLNISERTVKRYITAILTKLQLESRLQAGITALVIMSDPAEGGYPRGAPPEETAAQSAQ
jgi:DNA-binding CsgD family transcriptional regulator